MSGRAELSIAGSISLIEMPSNYKIPQEGYRLTKRHREAKKQGMRALEVELPLPNAGKLAYFYIRCNSEAEIPGILLSMLTSGMLKDELTPPDEPEAKIKPDTVSFSSYFRGILEPGGRLEKRRKLRGERIDVREQQAALRIAESFARHFNRPMDEYDDMPFLEEITTRMVHSGRTGRKAEYSCRKARELSPQTVRNRLFVISAVFEFAVEDGLIDNNPIPKAFVFLPPKSADKSFAPIPPEAEVKLFTQAELWMDLHSYGMLLVLALTGARIGEISALTPEDVDFSAHTFTISKALKDGGEISATKTRTTRIVPMCPLVEEVFKALIALGKPYIFGIGCKPYTRIKYARAFEKAMDAIGYPKKTRQMSGYVLHSFRHSFTSHMVAKGVSDTLISLITGHDSSTISVMNRRYTSMLQEAVPGLVEAIGSIFTSEETAEINRVIKALTTWKTRRI